jgi:hypothetical protein
MPIFLSKITFQFYQNNSLQRDINNNTLFLLIDMSLKQKTQNGLLMDNLMEFYKNKNHLKYMMNVISGETNISLRIVDWFVTNYAKKNYTIYDLPNPQYSDKTIRFKVYNDYKLKLKAYSKRRFDPFCRWERIRIPYDDENYMETTIGQLNFFKWAIENRIVNYIQDNYATIEEDMNHRNSISKKKDSLTNHEESSIVLNKDKGKTRKKREELSISACKCIKKENVKIVVSFNE